MLMNSQQKYEKLVPKIQINYKEHSTLMFNDKLYISKSLFIKLI